MQEPTEPMPAAPGGLVVPELAQFAPDATRGHVTVELSDADTGRVTHRETAENFLSTQSKAVAKWWQRMMWGAYLPKETSSGLGWRPSEMPWFPADHLAYWNDATAESSSTERNVAKELVGWASRHPVGSATGKRGVVNLTESEFTDTYAKWVFDWVTSQGNGTFQSVGWTRVHETNGFPMARYPEDELVSVTPPYTNAATRCALAWNGSASKWLTIALNATGSLAYVISTGTGGGATTTECTLSGWSSSSSVGLPYDLALLSTDYVVAGYKSGSGGIPRLGRNTSAGASTWARDETSLTGKAYNGVTVDGSGKIWTAGSDGIMRRHSASDGTIEVSVTPTLAPTSLHGIEYDSADGNFWISGIFSSGIGVAKVDNSGSTVGPLFGLNPTAFTVASTVGNPEPTAGVYYVPASAGRDTYVFAKGGYTNGAYIIRSASVGNYLSQVASYGAAVAVGSGGQLYLGTTSSGYCTDKISPLRGYTLGTRVKLSSPVTKTSSQNLKVTYQFDFV